MVDGEASFTRFRSSGRVTLAVEGDVDFTVAADFARELNRLISDGESVALVDLSGVTGFDASALGELEDAERTARRAAIDLVLVAPSPACRELLTPDRVAQADDGGGDLSRGARAEGGAMSSAQVRFERSDRPSGRTLTIDGEIDMAVGTELGMELAALIAEAHSPAFVDLSGVTFMDSTGIQALLEAARAGAAVDAPLVLVGASRPCRRVLEVSGVWELFQVREET